MQETQEIELKAPKHEFTLLCDDIRQEVDNKISIMGLYDHHVIATQVPITLAKICFYSRFTNMQGTYQFSFSIIAPDGECKDIVNSSDVEIPEGISEGTFHVTASPFDITTEGIYKAVIGFTKSNDRFEYIYQFAVADRNNM